MAIIGSLQATDLSQIRKKITIRTPPNPLDKSTIVSIYPMPIHEKKCTIQPGDFRIPAGSFDKPSLLQVGQSSWWRDIDENQDLEIPQGSIQVAESIVMDYCKGVLGYEPERMMPGLFYVIGGDWTIEKLKKEHLPLLLKYKRMQDDWFKELIRVADILWARTNGNPLGVPDQARLGARELGIKDKPWLTDSVNYEKVPCIACGSLRNPAFPICQVCKAIADPVKAKELGLVFAQ